MSSSKGFLLPLPELLELYECTDDVDIREAMRSAMVSSIRQDLERSCLTMYRPKKRLIITGVGS